MTDKPISRLSDIATEAHMRIQRDFEDINPIVGVTQNMRTQGVPADAMTIDCLKSGKRIILISHDEQPNLVRYQFSFREKDPTGQFELIELEKLTAQILYGWIERYFSGKTS